MSTIEAFAAAMGRLAGAVTLITAAEAGRPYGLVATAVCSVSAAPPSVLVCVNRSASAHDAIVRQQAFAINLPEVASTPVVERFTSRTGADRFEPGAWHAGITGAPLLDGARASLDCRLAMVHDGFSHSIFVGVVESVMLAGSDDTPCLLWHDRRFHMAMPLQAA